jgi:ankyrin repeat protein
MAAEVESALERATEIFGLCPNRVWSIAYNLEQWQKKLPRLIPSAERGKKQMKIVGHAGHKHCTLDLCEYSRLDFTSVKQRHEQRRCQDVPCGTFTELFPRALLEGAALADRPTAWRLDGKALVASPEEEPVMAISHVWSDGTGAGGWAVGEVNRCLYEFFRGIAGRFQCRGIWWDTICMPREKAARTRAINKIQSNYETARITLVHDCYIRRWEWVDAETACLAIIMSPWFSRGWTALELAKSRKVKVVFKDSVIKDLDEDILPRSRSAASAAHRFASDAISRLRTGGVPSINHLLTIMVPRFTSWPRDIATICGLLAEVDIAGHMRPHEIYQKVLRKIGKVRHGHLFHRSATMQGNFSWCPTNLLDLPVAHSTSDELTIQTNGQVAGEWIVIDLAALPEQRFVFNSTHPLSDVRLKTALTNPGPYALLAEPWESRVSRAILVRRLSGGIYKYMGVVSLQPALTPDDAGSQEWRKESVTIGDIAHVRQTSSSRVDSQVYENTRRSGDKSWMSMAKIIAQGRFPTNNFENWDYEHHVFDQSGRFPPFVPSRASDLKRQIDDEDCGEVDEQLLPSAGNEDEPELSDDGEVKSKARNSWTALHRAVWLGQRSTVRFLLRRAEESVDIPDRLGQQVFHLAAERGDLNILMPMLKYIKRYKACLDGQTVLHRAVLGGSEPAVAAVLSKLDVKDSQDLHGKTALHLAAELGQTEIARFLLSKQANPTVRDVSGRTALHYAAMYASGTDEMIRTLLGYDGSNIADLGGHLPLHYAAEQGHVPSVRILLQHTKLDLVDSSNQTPLELAAGNGHPGAVQALLEADRDHKLTQPTRTRALYRAASCNDTKVVRLLVEQGADIWADEAGGGIIIKRAIDSKNSPLTMFLAEAVLSAPDKHGHLPKEWPTILKNDPTTGQTPLLQAMERGYARVVMHLVPEGPGVFEKVQDGLSPLPLAVRIGKQNVVCALLERHRQFLRAPLGLKPPATKRLSSIASSRRRLKPSPKWDRACTCYWLAMRDLFQAQRMVANDRRDILGMLDPHVLCQSEPDIRKLGTLDSLNAKHLTLGDDDPPDRMTRFSSHQEDTGPSNESTSGAIRHRTRAPRRFRRTKKGWATRRLELRAPKRT